MVVVVVVVYLSTCKVENEAILRDFLSFWTWQHQKRSNSARLPQSLNLTTSKTKQFCETSSAFEVGNIKNEAILRDFLQKWIVECRADGLVPMRFAIFLLYLSKVPRLPGKSEARSYEAVHLSRKIILANLKNLMIQSETPLRKSALWPPNISADWTCLLYCACHGKCIFTDPVQMSHACQRFWKCYKILTFCFLLARWRIGRFTMMVSPTAKTGCNADAGYIRYICGVILQPSIAMTMMTMMMTMVVVMMMISISIRM